MAEPKVGDLVDITIKGALVTEVVNSSPIGRQVWYTTVSQDVDGTIPRVAFIDAPSTTVEVVAHVKASVTPSSDDEDGPVLQPEEVRRLGRQVAGWACIRCGAAPAPDRPMKPAGFVDGRQVFWCSNSCTPVKEHAASADEVEIPAEVAAHVLFHFGQGGWPTSGFRTTFMLAIAQADVINRNRLALGFPEYVAAFNMAQLADGGVAKLQAIVERDDA